MGHGKTSTSRREVSDQRERRRWPPATGQAGEEIATCADRRGQDRHTGSAESTFDDTACGLGAIVELYAFCYTQHPQLEEFAGALPWPAFRFLPAWRLVLTDVEPPVHPLTYMPFKRPPARLQRSHRRDSEAPVSYENAVGGRVHLPVTVDVMLRATGH